MRNNMNKKFAFTTAELMVAIAVLGVLAALMIPALRYSVQKRVFAYSREIQTKKLAQAITMLSVRSSRMGVYTKTSAFVNDLRNFAKISKMCESDKIANCWPYDKLTLADGTEYEIANATGPSVFIRDASRADYASDNVAFVTDNGNAVIINYNKDCDPNRDGIDVNKSCYMALMDVNGSKTPNKVGEDVFVINAKGFVVEPVRTSDSNTDDFEETTGVNMAPPEDTSYNYNNNNSNNNFNHNNNNSNINSNSNNTMNNSIQGNGP